MQGIADTVLFLVGLLINSKVVLNSLREKETKIWQIQVVYSISITIMLSFGIPFLVVLNAVEHLAGYTGEWICNLAQFLLIYGATIGITHSLVTAIMNYIFIVHPLKAFRWEHEKIQRIFLSAYLIFPLVLSISFIVIKSIQNEAIRKCFGLDDTNIGNVGIDRFLYTWECNMVLSEDDAFKTAMDSVCLTRNLLFYVLISNIPDAFFYYKIFTTMKR